MIPSNISPNCEVYVVDCGTEVDVTIHAPRLGVVGIVSFKPKGPGYEYEATYNVQKKNLWYCVDTALMKPRLDEDDELRELLESFGPPMAKGDGVAPNAVKFYQESEYGLLTRKEFRRQVRNLRGR